MSRSGSVLVLLLLAATAWGFGPPVVPHAFEFDVLLDSQDVELLDYRYGDSKLTGAANPRELRDQGRSPQRMGVTGPMRKGESLHVKWRIKSTTMVHEDTVDLRTRLPADMTDHRIYFTIRGTQLYVYLISPQKRQQPDAAFEGPRKYRYLQTTTIYPDQPKQ